jgi:4-carboxymuconolactone decarboxylase
MKDSEAFRRGRKVRAEIMGEAHVASAMATADDFGADMQYLTTAYCWGEVWSRPGLDRRTRSLLVLVMLTAQNRPDELRQHIRAALTNGASREDIREAFLQAAIYCGVPAAISSFRIAREVFAAQDSAA